ncbi:MAG: FAD binding domain-containing protein [Planctomycetota bacterium]
MILPPFELHQPETLEELLALTGELSRRGEDFDFLAGGTDILPNYKNRLNPRPHVVALSGLGGLDEIDLECIGARALVSDLGNSSVLSEHFPGLVEAARLVSSPPLRNLGTVGGNLLLDTRCFYFNQSRFWRDRKGSCMKADGDACLVVPQKEICYATYSGDLAPIFLVLDAAVDLLGPRGERGVPLREFYALDGITRFVKKPEELLLRVRIPKEAQRLRTAYRKLRVRDTIEYPVMGVAMGLSTKAEKIEELHVAVTGSEAVPLYYGDLGLRGRPADESTADALREALLDRVKTYRNVPFPPGYRKAMAGEFAHELLLALR